MFFLSCEWHSIYSVIFHVQFLICWFVCLITGCALRNPQLPVCSLPVAPMVQAVHWLTPGRSSQADLDFKSGRWQQALGSIFGTCIFSIRCRASGIWGATSGVRSTSDEQASRLQWKCLVSSCQILITCCRMAILVFHHKTASLLPLISLSVNSHIRSYVAQMGRHVPTPLFFCFVLFLWFFFHFSKEAQWSPAEEAFFFFFFFGISTTLSLQVISKQTVLLVVVKEVHHGWLGRHPLVLGAEGAVGGGQQWISQGDVGFFGLTVIVSAFVYVGAQRCRAHVEPHSHSSNTHIFKKKKKNCLWYQYIVCEHRWLNNIPDDYCSAAAAINETCALCFFFCLFFVLGFFFFFLQTMHTVLVYMPHGDLRSGV